MRTMKTVLTICLLATLALTPVRAQTNAAPAGMTLGTTNEPTTITCVRWRYEYAKNVATFEENVLAVNPRLTMRSDKMFVELDSSQSVSNIIAIGHVILTTPKNEKATGERAVYTAYDRRLVVSENPVVNARGTVWTGDRIAFILDDKGIKDITVETDNTSTNRSHLIIYPDAQKKKTNEPAETQPKP